MLQEVRQGLGLRAMNRQHVYALSLVAATLHVSSNLGIISWSNRLFNCPASLSKMEQKLLNSCNRFKLGTRDLQRQRYLYNWPRLGYSYATATRNAQKTSLLSSFPAGGRLQGQAAAKL